MPPGARKRKAAKRKSQRMAAVNNQHRQQQDSSTSPNPNSQGSENEKRPVAIEGDSDEPFETPRFQPETPGIPPETPYYSLERLRIGRRDDIEGLRFLAETPYYSTTDSEEIARRDEIEGSSEECVLVGENSKGLDVEITPKNEVDSLEERKYEELESSDASEGLKETKEEAALEKLETENDIQLVEKSVDVDEERTPKASIKAVGVSMFDEKEVKVVPWPDVEIDSINGEAKAGIENGDRDIETEFEKDEGFKKKKLDNLVEKKEHEFHAAGNSKDVLESVQEILPQIDVDFTSDKLEKSVEKSFLPIKSSALIAKESADKTEIIEKSVAVDEESTPITSIEAIDVSSSNEKEVKVVPWPDEEIAAVNGEVNGDTEVVTSEKEGEGDGDRYLQVDVQKNECLNKNKLENLVEENEQPFPDIENSKDFTGSVEEILPEIDADCASNKLDKSAEKSILPVKYSVPITEETADEAQLVERTVSVDEERTPNASIVAVAVSSSREKEVKVVPLSNEEIDPINGEVNGGFEVVTSDKKGEGDGDRDIQRQFQKNESIEETKLENLVKENEQSFAFTKRSKDAPESAQEILPRIDVDLSNKLEESAEKSFLPVKSSALITEKTADETQTIEKSLSVDKERTLNSSIGIVEVDVSSSDKKEVKVVLRDEEVVSVNAEVNGGIEIYSSEKGAEIDGDRDLQTELQKNKKNKGLRESELDNPVKENEYSFPGAGTSKDVTGSVQEILPQIDVVLSSNKLDKFFEGSSLPIKDSVLITEEVTQGNRTQRMNPESEVGTSNFSPVKEAADPSLDATQIEIAERYEIACSQPVVRRATFWNCCGLFEVLTRVDK